MGNAREIISIRRRPKTRFRPGSVQLQRVMASGLTGALEVGLHKPRNFWRAKATQLLFVLVRR